MFAIFCAYDCEWRAAGHAFRHRTMCDPITSSDGVKWRLAKRCFAIAMWNTYCNCFYGHNEL